MRIEDLNPFPEEFCNEEYNKKIDFLQRVYEKMESTKMPFYIKIGERKKFMVAREQQDSFYDWYYNAYDNLFYVCPN